MEPRTPRTMLPGNRRLHVVVAVIAGVIFGAVVGTVVLDGGGGGNGPASNTAKLVPASALVYVHLSTDEERPATERALEVARRFPGWTAARDRLVRQLVAAGRQGATGAGVRPWLGDEAALALTDRGGSTAGSLVLLGVTDVAAANRYLERGQRDVTETTARDVKLRAFGTLVTGIVGDTLVIGQMQSVREAVELSTGRGRALADDRSYREAMQGMPEDRVGDAWATADGLRRLLIPQGNVLGVLGTVADQPGLRAAALAVTAEDDGLRLRLRRLVDRDAQGAGEPESFAPSLAAQLPATAFAFADVQNLAAITERFRGLTPAGSDARELLDAAQKGGTLRFLRGEVGVGLLPGVPAAVLTIVARTDDVEGARKAVRALKKPLRGEVRDGKVVVSTSDAGLAAARDPQRSLQDAEIFKKAIGDAPNGVSSLLFLDFTQLLRLGEQTGLRDNRDYLAVAPDLEKVRAVGVSSTAEEGASTAEIFLLIP